MKKLSGIVLFSTAGFVLVLAACAQERVPGQAEFDLLASIAGEYTYEYQEAGSAPQTGTIAFEPFAGGRYVRFDESWNINADSTMGILGIIGYDSIGEYFTWYRVFDNGAYDHARGTLEDGTITFDITETRSEPWGEVSWAGPGVKLRTKWTDFTENGFTFIWERSVDGGPWEHLSEGRDIRVR